MHERENALKDWLVQILPSKPFTLQPLAGDASFRRYFRLQQEGVSRIIMDAPPEKESLESFIHITLVLNQAHILVPHIYAEDRQHGFLLLSDLGDELLINKLSASTVSSYYQKAMHVLFDLQKCSIADPNLAAFDKVHMLKEMNLSVEWFFTAYLGLELTREELTLIHDTFDWIGTEVAKQPVVFIHRDYHSRNLMVIESNKECTLGLIDYQDAMQGPITYDLVSLLKDCYVSWPRESVLEWLNCFYSHQKNLIPYTFDEWVVAFDLCGLQRHLKVLGVFSRLYLRDGKAGYLADLPLTLNYILECCEIHKELHAFFNFLQKRVRLP